MVLPPQALKSAKVCTSRELRLVIHPRTALTVSVKLLCRLSGLYICKKMLHTTHCLPPASPEQRGIKLLVPRVCSTGFLVIRGNKADSREKAVTSWCFEQQLQHPQIHRLPLKDLAWICSRCSRLGTCIRGEACSRHRNSWTWGWEGLYPTETNKEGGESSAGGEEGT